MFKKYCPEMDHIISFGDTIEDNLPDNVEFISVGNPWDWLDQFGLGMKKALEMLDDDVVFISLPDMWPMGLVDMDLLARLVSYMHTDKNVFHALVCYLEHIVTKGITYHKQDDLELAYLPLMDSNLGMLSGPLLWPSLWNRESFIPLIIDRTTIWDFEEAHTQKMTSMTDRIGVWTRQIIYPYSHVLSRQNAKQIHLATEICPEDVEMIRSLIPDDVEILCLWE